MLWNCLRKPSTFNPPSRRRHPRSPPARQHEPQGLSTTRPELSTWPSTFPPLQRIVPNARSKWQSGDKRPRSRWTSMDDIRFGAAIRAARVRRGWRQVDLAIRAVVSASLGSRIERGHLDGIQLATLRAVAAVLEVRVELLPRSRAADLDRLINARHAALSEAMAAWLAT